MLRIAAPAPTPSLWQRHARTASPPTPEGRVWLKNSPTSTIFSKVQGPGEVVSAPRTTCQRSALKGLVASIELLDEGGAPPAAVIGLPVGFVGAAESKVALMAAAPAPALTVLGRLGGSAITVAAVNSLASRSE